MDQKQTKQALLKKPIQILLSIFALSILLFTLSPLLPPSSHFLSNFSGKISSYTPDRNYVFLFCNGILAFLIKISLPAGYSQNQQMHQKQTKQALLEKSIQILLSIFAFSILFTLSPLLPLPSHYLSNFSGNISSYTPDRNYIFLFYIGILAFLIKDFLRASSCQGSFKQNVQNQRPEPELADNGNLIPVVVVVDEEKPAREDNGNLIPVEEEEEEEEEEEDDDDEILVAIEEEEEENDGMGLLSAEEFNKKCDDFIRTMREEIMIEAQRWIVL